MTLEHILQQALLHFKMERSYRTGNDRSRDIVEARVCYSHACRIYTRESTDEIGKKINKDHSTVVHYTKLIRDIPDVDRKFKGFEKFLFADAEKRREQRKKVTEVFAE